MVKPAVFVFVQEGCPACHEFMPRFAQAARQLQGLPVGIYDIARDGRSAEFANKLGINATPTMVVLTRAGRLVHHVGALGVRAISSILNGV